MYVCVCNAVREADIKAAVDNGARSLACLQERLQVSTCCGSCAPDAQDCLSRFMGEAPVAQGSFYPAFAPA